VTQRLVFVYNANAGLLAGALDSIHKTLSPGTYACDLCALTYGALTMRPSWRRWLQSIPMETDFYHRPDFRLAYAEYANEPLPLVGIASNADLSVLLDRDALSNVQSLDQLIAVLQSKLSPYLPPGGWHAA
jgi:hypothetical protein